MHKHCGLFQTKNSVEFILTNIFDIKMKNQFKFNIEKSHKYLSKTYFKYFRGQPKD